MTAADDSEKVIFSVGQDANVMAHLSVQVSILQLGDKHLISEKIRCAGITKIQQSVGVN